MKNFITFEGGEGCGKTTVIGLLSNYLTEKGIVHITTREPGGLPENEEIRKILKSSKNLSGRTQLLLFSACRSHLLKEVIKPALERGSIVLCDRFYDSSRVYQGYCGDLSDSQVMSITDFAIDGVIPEITFFLNINPLDAFKRKGGYDKGDVFEEAGMEFHKKVREGFLKLAKEEPDRFVIIDASKPAQEVFEEVLGILKKERVIDV